jgi:hypothetical protein
MNSIQSTAIGRMATTLRLAAVAGMALTVSAGAGPMPNPAPTAAPNAAVVLAPAAGYSITLNTGAITISRTNPLGPSVGGARTHPTVNIVATLRPSTPAASGVMLALLDTSFPVSDGRNIGRWPMYFSFFGGVVSQRTTPPWTQTIRFLTLPSVVSTGVHRCKIVVMNPQGGAPLAEAPLMVTVVDP